MWNLGGLLADDNPFLAGCGFFSGLLEGGGFGGSFLAGEVEGEIGLAELAAGVGEAELGGLEGVEVVADDGLLHEVGVGEGVLPLEADFAQGVLGVAVVEVEQGEGFVYLGGDLGGVGPGVGLDLGEGGLEGGGEQGLVVAASDGVDEELAEVLGEANGSGGDEQAFGIYGDIRSLGR